MQKDKHEQAIEQFLKLIKQHPDHQETQVNLAASYLRQGLLKEGELTFAACG